jgi:DNA-binding FadR family transcriptional regulator
MFGAIKEQKPEAAEKASRQHILEAVKLLHADKGTAIPKIKRGRDA